MKKHYKKISLSALFVLFATCIFAQQNDTMFIHMGQTILELPVKEIDSIVFHRTQPAVPSLFLPVVASRCGCLRPALRSKDLSMDPVFSAAPLLEIRSSRYCIDRSGNVVYACPSGETCVCAYEYQNYCLAWGCCPYENANFCINCQRCCPPGWICLCEAGVCIRYGGDIPGGGVRCDPTPGGCNNRPIPLGRCWHWGRNPHNHSEAGCRWNGLEASRCCGRQGMW